jgi:hypothetical protein
VRPAALRQCLVDLNLALHGGPPVLTFFEAPIFLPNKISRKDNKRPKNIAAAHPAILAPTIATSYWECEGMLTSGNPS